MTPQRPVASDAIDLTVARLLTIGSYLSIALIAIGVVLMVATGRSPLDPPAHGFEPGALVADLLAGRPDGPLWLGLVVLLATPSARVAASIVGYLHVGERPMALVGAAILAVVAAGVVVGVVLGIGGA